VVPKHGQSAVRRNRLKRVLRELTRVHLLEPLGRAGPESALDVVIRALPRAYRVTREELQAAFDELRQRLLRVLESRGGESRVAGSAGPSPE
jgi:ribonuclease P protein component